METIDLFLSRPLALFVVLTLGAAIGLFIEQLPVKWDRDRSRARWRTGKPLSWRQQNGNVSQNSGRQTRQDPVDFAAQQLVAVMHAEFSGKAVFNSGELRLFRVLEACLTETHPKWRVMGQVSLGEILGSADKDAFLAINSKRVDMLIIDEASRPVHVIEFQGSGHHLSKNAAARDAVKKEALRRAGIGYTEIFPGDKPAQIRTLISGFTRAIAA